MAEDNTTAAPGFWAGLGQSLLTKGVDLADSYAAMRIAQDATKTQTQAAEQAAAAAPQNVGTKTAATAPAPLGAGLSTGLKIALGVAAAAVLGLFAWMIGRGGKSSK